MFFCINARMHAYILEYFHELCFFFLGCTANEAFERLANTGLLPNMILYLTREYNMKTTAATNVLFIWSAASHFLPILGAFVADSYVSRYPIIGFGCITSLLVKSFIRSLISHAVIDFIIFSLIVDHRPVNSKCLKFLFKQNDFITQFS